MQAFSAPESMFHQWFFIQFIALIFLYCFQSPSELYRWRFNPKLAIWTHLNANNMSLEYDSTLFRAKEINDIPYLKIITLLFPAHKPGFFQCFIVITTICISKSEPMSVSCDVIFSFRATKLFIFHNSYANALFFLKKLKDWKVGWYVIKYIFHSQKVVSRPLFGSKCLLPQKFVIIFVFQKVGHIPDFLE